MASDGRDPRDRGMLDWPKRKLARHCWRLWESLESVVQPRVVRAKVNHARRLGDRFVGMVKDQDTNLWRLYTPPNSRRVPPSLSRGRRLCRRITAQMFQDPPLPEATPSRDDDDARDASELATRILSSLGGESGVNNLRSAQRAFDKIHDYGSGFRYHYVDPEGGGAGPRTILASKAALTEDEAIERTETVMGMQGPVTRTVALPEPYVPRFVRPDGSLTDDEAEAEEVWTPRLCHEVHTPKTVRMWPPTAQDVSEARLVFLLAFRSWGDVKRLYPEVEQLDDEAQKRITTHRPKNLADYLPNHLTEQDLEGPDRPSDKLSDNAICVLLLVYAKAGPEASDGLYAVIGGSREVIARDEWLYRNEDTGKIEPLDIPVDQFKGWEEGDEDQYGFGTMDWLGEGDELLAQIDGARVLHFQRLGNRKTFLPMTSSLTPRALQATTATVIPYSGGKPEFEDLPSFPTDIIELRKTIADEMTDESGLQPAAQGQDTPNIQSGFHAVQMIEQSLAGMADLRQHAADALERGWRVDLQLMRAFFSGFHILRQVGPDNALKVRHWTAAELGDCSDVRVLRGTFSMMSPSMKSSIALAMSQNGLLTREGLMRATSGGTGGLMALQDDPHILRVRRQVAIWELGPQQLPDGQFDPMSPSPFDYRPVDDQQDVAAVRAVELGRAMASTHYSRMPIWWQQGLVDTYMRAFFAAQGQVQPPPPPPNQPPAQLPPGATPGAGPQTPPIVGQPANAMGAREPDAAIAGLEQPAPEPSPLLEGGPPRFSGTPLPAPSTTLPV